MNYVWVWVNAVRLLHPRTDINDVHLSIVKITLNSIYQWTSGLSAIGLFISLISIANDKSCITTVTSLKSVLCHEINLIAKKENFLVKTF